MNGWSIDPSCPTGIGCLQYGQRITAAGGAAGGRGGLGRSVFGGSGAGAGAGEAALAVVGGAAGAGSSARLASRARAATEMIRASRARRMTRIGGPPERV